LAAYVRFDLERYFGLLRSDLGGDSAVNFPQILVSKYITQDSLTVP
jgi:hypothetical protein